MDTGQPMGHCQLHVQKESCAKGKADIVNCHLGQGGWLRLTLAYTSLCSTVGLRRTRSLTSLSHLIERSSLELYSHPPLNGTPALFGTLLFTL